MKTTALIPKKIIRDIHTYAQGDMCKEALAVANYLDYEGKTYFQRLVDNGQLSSDDALLYSKRLRHMLYLVRTENKELYWQIITEVFEGEEHKSDKCKFTEDFLWEKYAHWYNTTTMEMEEGIHAYNLYKLSNGDLGMSFHNLWSGSIQGHYLVFVNPDTFKWCLFDPSTKTHIYPTELSNEERKDLEASIAYTIHQCLFLADDYSCYHFVDEQITNICYSFDEQTELLSYEL